MPPSPARRRRLLVLAGAAVLVLAGAAAGAYFAFVKAPGDVSNPEVTFSTEADPPPPPPKPKPRARRPQLAALRFHRAAHAGPARGAGHAAAAVPPPLEGPGRGAAGIPARPRRQPALPAQRRREAAVRSTSAPGGSSGVDRSGHLAASDPGGGRRDRLRDRAGAHEGRPRPDHRRPGPHRRHRLVQGPQEPVGVLSPRCGRPRVLRDRGRHALRAGRRDGPRALALRGIRRGEGRPGVLGRVSVLRRLRWTGARGPRHRRQAPLVDRAATAARSAARARSTRRRPSGTAASTSATPTAGCTRSPRRSGKLAWATRTGGYVYASPVAATVPGLGPTVFAGSYDGSLYAFDARSGAVRWSQGVGGRISGGATLIGSVVYVAELGNRRTHGLRRPDRQARSSRSETAASIRSSATVAGSS